MPPKDDPVGGAVLPLSQHQGDAQQADGSRRHEPADLLHPFQVPQEDAQDQEERQTQQHREKLLGKGRRRGGRRH